MGHLPATTRRYSPSLMRANVIVFYPFSCSNVKTIFRVPGPETPAPLCIAKRHKRSDTKFTLPQQFTPPQHQTYDKTTTYYNSRWIKPDHTMREQHNFSPLPLGIHVRLRAILLGLQAALSRTLRASLKPARSFTGVRIF
jgi:hypothetical protein